MAAGPTTAIWLHQFTSAPQLTRTTHLKSNGFSTLQKSPSWDKIDGRWPPACDRPGRDGGDADHQHYRHHHRDNHRHHRHSHQDHQSMMTHHGQLHNYL